MKQSVKKAISYFIQGLLALLPLIVSGYVVIFIFSFIGGLADNALVLLPEWLRDMRIVRVGIESVAIALFFISVTLFGILVRTMIGRLILTWMDAFFENVPGINTIYIATKQVVEVLRSGKKRFFTHPVLVEYPSPGIWAVAFNTGETDDLFGTEEGKRYTVFIPTSPNPTSGFLAVLPREKIRELDMSVEDAIRLILTGGIVKRGNASGEERRG